MGICIPQRNPRIVPFVKSAANTEELRIGEKLLTTPEVSHDSGVASEEEEVEEVTLAQLVLSSVTLPLAVLSCRSSSSCSISIVGRVLVRRRGFAGPALSFLDSASRFPTVAMTLAFLPGHRRVSLTYVSLFELVYLGSAFSSWDPEHDTRNRTQSVGMESSLEPNLSNS